MTSLKDIFPETQTNEKLYWGNIKLRKTKLRKYSYSQDIFWESNAAAVLAGLLLLVFYYCCQRVFMNNLTWPNTVSPHYVNKMYETEVDAMTRELTDPVGSSILLFIFLLFSFAFTQVCNNILVSGRESYKFSL